jgi:lycopene beta-cyclase
MSKYMGVLLLAAVFPLSLSFYPPLKFWRNFKALSLTLILTVVIFGAWDIFAVWRGHWNFSSRNIYGVRIVNLPVEEWLFFLVIPFCCIFTWEALWFIKKRIK